MTRISEKVKDLIEVCSYQSVVDFRKDPSETLAGYHFTDITSQLMSNWLDSLVDLQSRKTNAKALAGYRGVGKSHFLSAFTAIVANPELRSGLHDTLVASSAHHLMRRTYPVAFVKRGTKGTLDEELRLAVAASLNSSIAELPEGLNALVDFVESLLSDVPLVIIVDTAMGREKRVARDDGVYLGELAEAIRDKNIFVGVALDDDITDADGINSAIAQSYTIDYLDQEHLYRIVDTHIFRKHRQAQELIQEIYSQFRQLLPAFKWSEPRFASLYPLHPAILEVAPFIRLYAPEFALLGFASEAGARILGRPANSLIALDEVFDKVEGTLRKAPDLKEAFETYDAISKEMVSLIPVMQRLEAKLILKALFVLSMDGDGTTPAEIAAAMLIFDEADPTKSETGVAELLETFVSIFPDQLHRKEENGEIRFSFKVAGKDDLLSALSEAVERVPDSVVPRILSKVANDRFSDWQMVLSGGDDEQTRTDCHAIWRGGQRKGRISWNWGTENLFSTSDGLDLEVFVVDPETDPSEFSFTGEKFWWKPSKLTKEETETIRRYYLLLNDEQIKSQFSDQIRAAGHTHSQNIVKIWERVFVTDAVVYSDNTEYKFDDSLLSAATVGEILAGVLEPRFEECFSGHPEFDRTLELSHVSLLVNDLFSGARISNAEVQANAASFALPLGLVSEEGENLVLGKEEELLDQPAAEKVLELLGPGDETVPLTTVFEALREAPFGLVKEAQQLILAALVAHRKVEFVTSAGDRISRRSLDLKIIWDDIDGIAIPADVQYESKRLNEWAKVLTGIEDELSIEKAEDRKKVIEGLGTWLKDWEEANIVKRFGGLPDEVLNTKIWQTSVNVERSFGGVARILKTLENDSNSLEDILARIADSFSDSDHEYRSRESELVSLVSFIKSASQREAIWGYLAVCEITDDEEIEAAREKLLKLMETGHLEPNAATNKEIATRWMEFRAQYSEYFAVKHDAIMKSHQLQEQFDEYTKSDEWWEFERLSSLAVFQDVHWNEAQKILRQLWELDCSFDVRQRLTNHPFCACSFNLAKIDHWEKLPEKLEELVDRARDSYRRTLKLIAPDLIRRLESFVKEESEKQFTKAAAELLKAIDTDSLPALLTTDQLTILQKILNNGRPTQMAAGSIPEQGGIQSAEVLREALGEWLDDLPAEPVLIKIS
ncbi:MAG: hypothetical protein HKN33_09945 [Pyrinomonadaceae bacterium]|nr:hypothetical protein [Pyrinomonadaceae bacterium]